MKNALNFLWIQIWKKTFGGKMFLTKKLKDFLHFSKLIPSSIFNHRHIIYRPPILCLVHQLIDYILYYLVVTVSQLILYAKWVVANAAHVCGKLVNLPIFTAMYQNVCFLLTYGKFTVHLGKISAVKLKTSWKFGKKKV